MATKWCKWFLLSVILMAGASKRSFAEKTQTKKVQKRNVEMAEDLEIPAGYERVKKNHFDEESLIRSKRFRRAVDTLEAELARFKRQDVGEEKQLQRVKRSELDQMDAPLLRVKRQDVETGPDLKRVKRQKRDVANTEEKEKLAKKSEIVPPPGSSKLAEIRKMEQKKAAKKSTSLLKKRNGKKKKNVKKSNGTNKLKYEQKKKKALKDIEKRFDHHKVSKKAKHHHEDHGSITDIVKKAMANMRDVKHQHNFEKKEKNLRKKRNGSRKETRVSLQKDIERLQRLKRAIKNDLHHSKKRLVHKREARHRVKKGHEKLAKIITL